MAVGQSESTSEVSFIAVWVLGFLFIAIFLWKIKSVQLNLGFSHTLIVTSEFMTSEKGSETESNKTENKNNNKTTFNHHASCHTTVRLVGLFVLFGKLTEKSHFLELWMIGAVFPNNLDGIIRIFDLIFDQFKISPNFYIFYRTKNLHILPSLSRKTVQTRKGHFLRPLLCFVHSFFIRTSKLKIGKN